MIAELQCVILAFQRATDYHPPRWPDASAPQQFHPDFQVRDLEVTHEQVLAAGTTVLDDTPGGGNWRVHGDPVSHPFCLVRRP